MRAWFRIACCVSALQVGVAPFVAAQEAPAAAGGEAEGRARFGRGIELYKEGNFHAALAEFRAAYAAAPSWRIQYNLGQTLYQLQDYAGALAAFERYEKEGEGKLDAAKKTEVDGEIAKLRQRVATITVLVPHQKLEGQTEAERVEIVVDDESKGTTVDKLEVVVSAGRRTFTATAPGYRSATRALDVAGSTRVVLQLPLEALNAPAAAKPVVVTQQPPREAPRHKSRWPAYAGLIVTGAGAAATVTFGLLAKREHDKFESALATPNISPASLDDSRKTTKTNALVTDIVGGVTIAAAVYTIVAFVLTSGTEEPVKESAKGVKVRPVIGPGGGGLVGTF